jgi:hypothetical protein
LTTPATSMGASVPLATAARRRLHDPDWLLAELADMKSWFVPF